MADLVNEIISEQAFKQLNDCIAKLEEATQAVSILAAEGKKVTFEFSGVKELSALNDMIAKSNATITQLTNATQAHSAAVNNLTVATNVYNASTKENADKLAQQRLELQYVDSQLKILNNDIKIGAGNIDLNNQKLADWTRRQQELKVEIGATTGALKSQIKEGFAASGSMDAMAQSLGQLREQYRALNAQQRASPMGQQIVKDIATLDKEIKGLDATIGLNQRSVGNYQLTWANLSYQLERMGVRFLLFFAAIELVTKGVKMFWAEITHTDEASTKAFKKVLEYLGKLKEIGDEAIGAAAKEKVHADNLLATASNINLSYKSRIDAIEELRKSYQGIFQDYTDEEILARKAAASEEKLTEAIILKARTKAYSSKIELEATRAAHAQIRIDEINDEVNNKNVPEDVRYAKRGIYARELVNLNKDIAKSEKLISDYKAKQLAIDEQYDSLVHGKHSGRTLEDIDTDIKVQERLRDTNIETSKAHIQAIASLKRLAEERKRFLGEEDKSKKDTTLASDTGLIKAIYDSKTKEYEISRDTNKAISEDTKKELGDRLVAYQDYMVAVLRLAQLKRDYEIDIEYAKQDDIERKIPTTKGNERKNLEEQLRASNIRIDTAQKEYNNKRALTEQASGKAIIEIVHSANSEWIKDEEDKQAKLAQLDAAGLVMSEQQLDKMLKSGEISRKEYNKRMAELVKQAKIIELQTEIDFDQKILENQQITDAERLKYDNKLAADRQKLAAAKAGKLSTDKNTGRITDGIAKLFVPADMENEEQYLQAFYDHTVDLAKKASDAIIESQNRQFDAKIRLLDKEKQLLQDNYQMQVTAIGVIERNEIERKNKIAKLTAQTAAQEADIEQQKRRVAQEQARFQRAASIASIIQNTAVAIAAALKYGAAAPPLIALIAAAGAVQLGVAANAPIPAYKHGTQNHPGGSFIAGDGGVPELIVPKNKSPYWSNSISTLYNEGAGTKVFTPQDITKFVSNTTYSNTKIEDIMIARQQQMIGKEISASVAKEFDKVGRNLAAVMYDTRYKPVKQEGMREAVLQIQRLGK